MDTKLCSKCGKLLPASDFYKRSTGNTLHSSCKVCERGMAKDWYRRNRERATQSYKDWRLQNLDAIKSYRASNKGKHYRQAVVRKYGVPDGWFDEQLRIQGNQCAACGVELSWSDGKTTPNVDHCHESGKVRGILCRRCNSVIGLCKDSRELLLNLVGYLRKCHG